MVFHHTGDAHELDFAPFFSIHLPQWQPVHLFGLTIDLSPTRHVLFMMLAAILTFLLMWLTARGVSRARRENRAPGGFSGAMEAFVLYIRDEVGIANIGKETGARYAPLVVTLFFFILIANLLGLVPWGASATGNLAVTGALAVLAFVVIEIGGLIKLGPGGYMRSIFPRIPGMEGPVGVLMSIVMGPLEILSKLVAPIALAVRLFGNMLAGHFVVLSLFGVVFLFGTLDYFRWGIGIATVAVVIAVMLLEIFVAFLQAYIFALLSATFIGLMQHEH